MPWAKFDDRFISHPKVLAAGPLAVALHMRAIIYASQHLTDGVIRRRQLNHILSWDDDADDFDGTPPRNADLVKRLVHAGLWDEAPDGAGWVIHDYLDWQPSRAEAEALAARRAEAGRKAGQASGASRRAKRDKDPEPTTTNERTNAEPNRSRSFSVRSSIVGAVFDADPSRGGGEAAPALASEGSGSSESSDVGDTARSDDAENTGESSRTNAEPNRSAVVRKSLNETRTKMNPVPVPVPEPTKHLPQARSDSAGPQPLDARARPAVVLTIPLVSGEHAVSELDVDEWAAAYPGVDVAQQLRAMRQWSLANPAKRKTRRGIRRFIVSWLGRQQDSGPPTNGGGTRARPSFAELTRAAMDWANAADDADGVRQPDV